MKKKSLIRCLKRWQWAIVCLMTVSLLPAVPARRGQARAVTYTVTDLGTLGGTQSFAYGVNACGRVVGRSSIAASDGNFHPFVGSGGPLTDIAPDRDNGVANSINELGFVAGAISGAHAFIWSAASGRQDIGVLSGGVASAAFDINENNLVVGISEIDVFGRIRGFVWQQSTGMQAIDTLGGSSSTAYAVNNAGTIVGSAQNASGVSHAYTLSGGVMSDLSTLGGPTSVAYGINDGGEVVGSSDIVAASGQPFHAFIWSSAAGMVDMGALGGSTRSVAFDINNAGQAVGYSELPAGRHAFIYTRTNGMSDLNDLVPGSGWIFQEAQAINNRGQIVGIGIFESDPDHQRAFMLTPDNAGPSPCSQAGTLQFDSAAYSVSESGLKRTITVTRTDGFGGAVSVNYATSDGTATAAGSDYQATSGTLSFAQGETSKTFDVNVNNDSVFEANETVNLTLSNPQGGATLGTPNTAVLTLNDNDAAPSFSIGDVTQAEGNAGATSFTFTVTKTGATELPASVQFNTADGTATTADGDYVSNSGTLNFAANEPTKQVVVNVNGDSKVESDETFTVTLSNPTNATIGDNQATGTITNDDAAPVPGTLQFSGATYSVLEGVGTATITVTRANGSDGAVSVNYATSGGGTATAGIDYTATSGTLNFANGETTKTFSVNINDDTTNEPDETVNLTLSNPQGGATLGTPGTAVLNITNDDTPRVQFSASAFAAEESSHVRVIDVTRTGDASLPVTVDYMVSDGTASQRTDYTFAFGTLRFAAGETSKSFDLLLTDDAFMEEDETINLSLSHPTGGAALGTQSTATVTIAANDNPPPGANPLDDPAFFVRMHYHDFLGRRPDDSGLDFWTGNITSCGADAGCREVKRINVSAAFFLSIEFQNTGYLVERMYKVAYGDAEGITQISGTPVQIPVPVIRRSEFLVDSAIIRDGLVVNVGNWEQVLENNKNAFALTFVQRQRFVDAYATTLTPAAFVQKLNQNTGNALTQAEAAALVAEFGGAADTADVSKRASVFRKVAENAEVDRRERNRAFVLMQFFGYLQRDPNTVPDADHTGWKFWLDKLEQFGGDFQQAEMVKAFISSDEYRKRFGP
jgi:probable HAF family extracellular repeat protein